MQIETERNKIVHCVHAYLPWWVNGKTKYKEKSHQDQTKATSKCHDDDERMRRQGKVQTSGGVASKTNRRLLLFPLSASLWLAASFYQPWAYPESAYCYYNKTLLSSLISALSYFIYQNHWPFHVFVYPSLLDRLTLSKSKLCFIPRERVIERQRTPTCQSW